jgi:hypothetical protein
MAARRAVPEHARRPARPGLQTAPGSRCDPAFEREDPGAAVEIARYLGNAYLETVARAAAAGGAATAARPECGARIRSRVPARSPFRRR